MFQHLREGGPGVLGCPGLFREFKVNLGYVSCTPPLLPPPTHTEAHTTEREEGVGLRDASGSPECEPGFPSHLEGLSTSARFNFSGALLWIKGPGLYHRGAAVGFRNFNTFTLTFAACLPLVKKTIAVVNRTCYHRQPGN